MKYKNIKVRPSEQYRDIAEQVFQQGQDLNTDCRTRSKKSVLKTVTTITKIT